MHNQPIQLPVNTTKRLGIGFIAAGLLLLISSAAVFSIGILLEAELIYVAIGATLCGLGLLAFFPGIGLFLQGREVDRILSGEDQIANWGYHIVHNGRREDGYIFIGKRGLYINGLHIKWSKKYLLEEVDTLGEEPKRLIFTYIIKRNNSDLTSTAAVRKRTSVPVPTDKLEDAERVVNYFSKQRN